MATKTLKGSNSWRLYENPQCGNYPRRIEVLSPDEKRMVFSTEKDTGKAAEFVMYMGGVVLAEEDDAASVLRILFNRNKKQETEEESPE